MLFAILYGFFATGGCFGFFPIVVAETFLAHYASALGLIFVWCAPGGLIGPVVSGILFDKYSTIDANGVRTTNYLPMQVGSRWIRSDMFILTHSVGLRRCRCLAGACCLSADFSLSWKCSHIGGKGWPSWLFRSRQPRNRFGSRFEMEGIWSTEKKGMSPTVYSPVYRSFGIGVAVLGGDLVTSWGCRKLT